MTSYVNICKAIPLLTCFSWLELWIWLGFVGFCNSQVSSSVDFSNGNPEHVVLANSSMPPEVLWPEYCMFSRAENVLSCNGEHVFPFPIHYPFNVSRLLLENFKKSELRPVDLQELRSGVMEILELRLPRNQINVVKDGVFTLLKGLRRLDLSGNKLSQVTNLTLIGLSSLLYLDLSSNRISAIDPGSFAYLQDLIQLDLNSNKLTNLQHDLLLGLRSLQYLGLEANEITEIQPDVFSHVPTLVHLTLSMNPLGSVEKVIFKLPHLQFCDFSHCGFRRVPDNFPPTIRDIRLTGNKLNSLQTNAFSRYSNLAILVLDDCNITELEASSWQGLTSLQRLWLNGNQLRKLPPGLPRSLRALYVDENNIKSVERKDVETLLDLEEIHLERNQITTIEFCSFCNLTHLHLLDLRGNRLEILNVTLFPPVNSLSSLDLSQNPLRIIGETFLAPLLTLKQLEISRVDMDRHLHVDMAAMFRGLMNLTTLDISGNPALLDRFLRYVIDSQENKSVFLPHLHTLNIRNCQVSVLDNHLQIFFSRLAKIKMAQNVLLCNVANRWVIDMIQVEQERFYKPHELKCTGPRGFKDQKILSVKTFLLRNLSNGSGEEMEAERRSQKARKPLLHTAFLSSQSVVSSPQKEYSVSLTVTVVGCILTAAIVSLGFILFMGWCSIGKLRLKQVSFCNKVAKIFHLAHEPCPELIGSTRTLYSTQNDSIYTINGEFSHVTLAGQPEAHVVRPNHLGFENDGLSTISSVRSFVEYRV